MNWNRIHHMHIICKMEVDNSNFILLSLQELDTYRSDERNLPAHQQPSHSTRTYNKATASSEMSQVEMDFAREGIATSQILQTDYFPCLEWLDCGA
jgi:hypothetical protein